MNIILFGFKSSGKTFLGRLLALKLSRPFIDTDEELEKLYFHREKKTLSCSEIFHKEGEETFHILEKEVIFSLKSFSNAVIALGGSALDEKVFPFLSRIGDLLYLKASLALILKRIKEQKLPAFVEKEKEPFQTIQKLFYEKSTFFQNQRTLCRSFRRSSKIKYYYFTASKNLWQPIALESFSKLLLSADPTAQRSAL